MSATKRFSLAQSNLTFTLNSGFEPIRSDHVFTKLKHCYEFKWLGGCAYHMIGFSNSELSKNYISYYHLEPDPRFYPYSGNRVFVGFKGLVGEEVCVCIDSQTNIFTVIKGNQKKEYRMTRYTEMSQTWNIFLYSGSGCNDLVKLNLGSSKFQNQIPLGYSTFVPIRARFKFTNNNQSSQNILFILVIIFNKTE